MKTRAVLAPVSLLFRPCSPMRGIDKDRSSRVRINPAAFAAAAGKNELVDLILFDHA